MRTKLAVSLLCFLMSGCADTLTGDDISIIFSDQVNSGTYANVLNTVEGTFTKDMVLGPPITIQLTLTGDERKRIYLQAKELGFFKLPSQIVDTGNRHKTPCDYYELEIKRGRRSHRVRWDDCECSEPEGLRQLRTLIYSSITSKDEYRRLPPIRGMYM